MKMELSNSNIKKFLIFSKKKVFLIFQETEIPKTLFRFQESQVSYISGNRNPKKTSYISGGNTQKLKSKQKDWLIVVSFDAFSIFTKVKDTVFTCEANVM